MKKSNQAHITDFAESVRELCSVLENHTTLSKDQFSAKVHTLLIKVYLLAQSLPDVHTESENGPEDLISEEEIIKVAHSVSDIFGRQNAYREVFDPYEDKDEVVFASLSDDLSDIYRYLKNPLIVYDRKDPASINEAVWNWKFGLSTSYGEHMTGAIRALHYLRHVY